MTMQDQPHEAAAISLFEEQRTKLQGVRLLDLKNPQFINWRNTTTTLFQRFLSPDSPHFMTFRVLTFRGQTAVRLQPFGYRGPVPTTTISPENKARFEADCAMAEECINGAIEEIRNFGVYSERVEVKAPQKHGGVRQTFHGPVVIHSQAIATDNAIQSIGQMGDKGASLREIAGLLDQSMDLTGRERFDGLKAIEVIASETKKPEPRRDWKSILDWGERLLSIAGKATDLTTKLAPHLPAITALIHEAMTHLP